MSTAPSVPGPCLHVPRGSFDSWRHPCPTVSSFSFLLERSRSFSKSSSQYRRLTWDGFSYPVPDRVSVSFPLPAQAGYEQGCFAVSLSWWAQVLRLGNIVFLLELLYFVSYLFWLRFHTSVVVRALISAPRRKHRQFFLSSRSSRKGSMTSDLTTTCDCNDWLCHLDKA